MEGTIFHKRIWTPEKDLGFTAYVNISLHSYSLLSIDNNVHFTSVLFVFIKFETHDLYKINIFITVYGCGTIWPNTEIK